MAEEKERERKREREETKHCRCRGEPSCCRRLYWDQKDREREGGGGCEVKRSFPQTWKVWKLGIFVLQERLKKSRYLGRLNGANDWDFVWSNWFLYRTSFVLLRICLSTWGVVSKVWRWIGLDSVTLWTKVQCSRRIINIYNCMKFGWILRETFACTRIEKK